MQPQTTQTKPATRDNTTATAKPMREQYVTPPIDVFEGKSGLVVMADLPGVKKEDLSLALDKAVLTVTATRKGDSLDVSTVYKRQFALPREVDLEQIQAKLEKGVLTLTLPRAEAAKPRQIQVNS